MKPILEFPIAHRHRNLVFNKAKQVWAFYRLSGEHLPLNSDSAFDRYLERTIAFLSQEAYAYHVMILPKRFDMDTFTQVMNQHIVQGEFSDIGKTYFDRAKHILEQEVCLHEYEVFLGVYLNKQEEVVTTDVGDFFHKFIRRVREDLAKLGTFAPAVEEDVAYYEEMEQAFRNKVAYHKQFHPLTEEELDTILYYHFHRTRDLVDIPDSTYRLTEGVLTQDYGKLRVAHQDYTEYFSFLPFSAMPVTMENHRFLQQLLEAVDFPVECQIRYHFQDRAANIRQVRKLKRRFSNFDREIQSTATADEDTTVEMASERLEDLLEDVKAGHRHLLFMTFTLVVADRSESVLQEKIEALQSLFQHTGFALEQPLVDQLTLFSQALPGSTTDYRYFEQVVDAAYLAQSGLDVSNKVGNRYGMVLGKVVTGKRLAHVAQARDINHNIVVFNPSLTKKSLQGASHTNGNILITGPSGSGKSMLVKNFFTWSTFFGTKVLYVDPKNEFQNYYREALHTYGDIPEFHSLYERINFVHLSEDRAYHGALDPLVFLEGDQAIQTAMMILNTLAEVRGSRDESVVIYDSVIEEVNASASPTLTGVLERITAKNTTLGRFIAKYNYGLGRMLFGHADAKGLDFRKQINVLGLQGLKLAQSDNMNDEERIGLCLMMSISKYVHTFSTNREEEAMIILDEAWILKRSTNGQELIDEMLRTGRSLKTDIVLVTQAYDDFNVDTTKEQIGVKFAFRPKSDDAIKPILRFYDMEENARNIEVVSNLKPGMCLFQDHLGRNQAIAIDILFEEWFEAFKTTEKASEAVHLEETYL